MIIYLTYVYIVSIEYLPPPEHLHIRGQFLGDPHELAECLDAISHFRSNKLVNAYFWVAAVCRFMI